MREREREIEKSIEFRFRWRERILLGHSRQAKASSLYFNNHVKKYIYFRIYGKENDRQQPGDCVTRDFHRRF